MSIPFRRVIPAGYHVCNLSLSGTSPLLMSSGEVDRDGDTFIAYEQLSKARGKSSEQKARLRELEWYTRLYWDEAVGVYFPGKNIHELLRASATKWRKGSDVTRSLVVPDYRIPLVYDGPRTPPELWTQGFRYTTMVANAGAGSGRVERTRPCFKEWALALEIAYDPEDLDSSLMESVVDRAQKYGIGDYRPLFGAFSATLDFVREERKPTNGSATKSRDGLAEKALSAMTSRIKQAA